MRGCDRCGGILVAPPGQGPVGNSPFRILCWKCFQDDVRANATKCPDCGCLDSHFFWCRTQTKDQPPRGD